MAPMDGCVGVEIRAGVEKRSFAKERFSVLQGTFYDWQAIEVERVNAR